MFPVKIILRNGWVVHESTRDEWNLMISSVATL